MISIVVVTWNRLDYTKRCVDSILRNTDVEAELILVDNGSTDGTGEWVVELARGFRPGEHLKEIRWGLFAENAGCAEGYNRGFKMAAGDPIFRIDNDVIVPCGWASAFLALWESDPRIGMMTTDIEPAAWERPEQVVVLARRGVTYFRDVWHDHGIGSWCMAHRRAMLDQVGCYRTDYGLIVHNDTDLEKRAEEAGWRLAVASGIRVGHLYGMLGTEDEARYNCWKWSEQIKHEETWNRIWGNREREGVRA